MDDSGRSATLGILSSLMSFATVWLLLGVLPGTVAAHGTTTGGLSHWHGIALLVLGGVITGVGILAKRYDKGTLRMILSTVFVGIVVAAIGAVLFDVHSPDPVYSASRMPFPRSFYPFIGAAVGLSAIVVSFFLGWLRWPTRPRYTFLGMLMGGWILYPYIVPGFASKNPLGYALVLGTPVAVGYVLWTDASEVLRVIMNDPLARRFGTGIGIVTGLFFLSITGYLSFFPEEGVPQQTVMTVIPAQYQLVVWPTFELLIPEVPFFLALSPGVVVIVGTLSVLVGIQASLIARKWRVDEQVGATMSTANTSAIVGTCTCGCCGPLVAKVAVLVAGPTITAPLYWVFVDTSSPLSVIFIVGSMLLFTGSILYSIGSVYHPDRSTDIASVQAD
ncbi:hypothetical protein B4589_004355 [Halolamina sp. CBA1230]|uniref:hypothetical protein n=1 Tax=Halolamina sp. CBA1230 TaxID=1853690 RepID=UPI00117BC0EE|nr:hypothetical protein [Halolamina sp. CBA1230]QKY19648.1 hypothetical protein B4589_004355 [Halolamina sp. CBA1230]